MSNWYAASRFLRRRRCRRRSVSKELPVTEIPAEIRLLLAHPPNEAEERLWHEFLDGLLRDETLRDGARTKSFTDFMQLFECVFQSALDQRQASAAVRDFLAGDGMTAVAAREMLAPLVYDHARERSE